jgi:hypothetical protein
VRKTRTSWLGLSLRRASTHRGMLAVFGLTVVLAALITTAVVGFLELSATRQATMAIASAGSDGQYLTLTTPIGDDAEQQQAAADDIVRSLIDTAALTVTTTRTTVDGRPSLTFDLRPSSDSFTASAIPGLVDGLSRLQRTLAADPVAAPSGVSSDGTLPTTLARAQARLSVEQAATGIPIALAAIIALVALAQGARLLVQALRDDIVLSRSRGASIRRAAITTAVMAGIVAVVSAAVGYACAAFTLSAWFATPIALVPITPPIAAAAAATAAVLIDAIRVSRASAAHDTARSGFVTNLATVVVIFALAAVSLGQLLLRRTPLQVSATGVSYVDPLIAAAPALALVAVVIVGLAAFAPLARLIEAASARSTGALVVYPARYVARHTALHTASATVVALAVASFVIAGAFASTATGLTNARQTLVAGGDLRITGVTDDRELPAVAVTEHTRVLVSAATVGADTVEIVGIPTSAIVPVMTTAAGRVDTARIARALPQFSGSDTVPAVVTAALASRLALSPGDRFTVDIGTGSRQFTATVADVVDLVPGTSNERAVVVDLDSVVAASHSQSGADLAPNEVWIRSDDLRRTLASLTGYSVVSRVSTSETLTASSALWLGALGAAALAIAALAAGATLSLRTRRAEPGLLLALGMSPRHTGRVVTAEQWIVVAIAVLLGAAAGLIVSAVTIPVMARASFDGVPSALATPLSVDVGTVAVAITIATCAFLAVGVSVGRRARSTRANGVAGQ